VTYVYLVASLPWLNLTEAPPLTVEEFRFRCQGVLTPEDLEELDRVLAGRWDELTSSFGVRWASGEKQLRNAVARVRAAHYNVDPREQLRPHSFFFGTVENGVTDAYTRGNPLERELAIDRCRWNLSNDLALDEPFGLGRVLGFALRLTLCTRWSSLKDEAGRARVEELVNALSVGPQPAET
jgi:hypothetical protein